MASDPGTCDLLCLDLPKAEAARAPAAVGCGPGRLGHRGQGAVDPTRLAVAVALAECGAACVCDLAWIVARDEKLVSHHVRALRAAGLAGSTRDGRMVMYALTDRGLALLTAVSATPASA